jgi:hypothetical protein
VLKSDLEGREIPWRAGSQIVPHLTRQDVEQFWPRVEKQQSEWLLGKSNFDLPLAIILVLMSRKYPSLTIEELKDNLTASTLRDLWHYLWWHAVNGAAGIAPKGDA